jgi:hypothetical protein
MSFAITGLPIDQFQLLFGLSDEDLASQGVLRRRVTREGRFPCRVTLEDTPPGGSVLLLNYEDHAAATPYRSRYAIFVSEAARETRALVDEIPGVLRGRPIALRAFSPEGMLLGAELALNDDVADAIGRRFADQAVDYIHAHNAAHGCFAARIERA